MAAFHDKEHQEPKLSFQNRPPEDVRRESVAVILRNARKELGQDLRTVAQVLRIRYVYLEAIEAGDFNRLPGTAYAIGFLRTYAEHLGIHGDDIIEIFKEEVQGSERKTELIFPEPVTEGRIPGGAIVLISVLLLGVAYGGWFYLSNQGKSVADLIPPLPERLEALVRGEQDTPVEGDTAVAHTPDAPAEPAAPAQVQITEIPRSAASTAAPPEEDSAPEPAVAAEPAETPVQSAETPQAPVQPDETPVELPEIAETPAEPEDVVGTPVPLVEEPSAPAPAPEPPQLAETPAAAPEAAKPPAPISLMPAKPPAEAPTLADITKVPRSVSTIPASRERPEELAARVQSAPERPSSPLTPAPVAQRTLVIPSPPVIPQIAAVPQARTPRVYGENNEDSRIVLRATQDSWVQVRDRDEALLLTRVLRVGDSYRVPNQDGLTLLTGNAGGIDIEVDGNRVPAIGPVGSVRRQIALDPSRLLQGTAASR